MFSDYIVRGEQLDKVALYVTEHYPKDEFLAEAITNLQNLDE